MYRSNARRVKRIVTWMGAALVAVGSGTVVADLTAPASVPRAVSSAPIATGTVATSATLSTTAATSAGRAVGTLTVSAPAGVVSPSTVVAVGPGSLTVRSRAGVVTTYALTSSTTVLRGRSRVSIATVRIGDTVVVIPSLASPTTAATVGVLPSNVNEGHESRTVGTGDGLASSDH